MQRRFTRLKRLKEEYASAVANGLFVKGTTYRNIVDHEAGHIISKERAGLTNKILSIFETEAQKQGVSLNQYIGDNISLYAADIDSNLTYHELVSEINSLLNSGKSHSIIELLRKEGVL